MRSMQDRLDEVLEELQQLDRAADLVVIDRIRWRVERLEDELQIQVADHTRRFELFAVIRQARALIDDAQLRAERSR
ncbi:MULTISPECIES: hypothetical protein [Nocardia]|uniref:Uncharacterized protein n=1 Tax=Nocardia sputorum TaxID=2984338 RepID=A0ABN6U5R3_9NOCA|nr:hypothetical protein [Nocardia sputorum]BDT91962.1 hypothetical protein IFM12275_19380 [Nocardia sputorum]BDU00564.1 hypothetical protein IFM12276_35920 [Nocardia sputorum]